MSNAALMFILFVFTNTPAWADDFVQALIEAYEQQLKFANILEERQEALNELLRLLKDNQPIPDLTMPAPGECNQERGCRI